MTAREPWLRPASGSTVPFRATLRGAGELPNAGPWARRGTAAAVPDPITGAEPDPDLGSASAPATGRCAACAELRASIDGARAEAIERGRRDGLEETAALRAKLAAAVAAVEQVRADRDQAVSEQVVDLALGLCAELAPAAAAIDRRGLVQLVARSLADAGGARDLVLQVSAEDAAAVGTQLPAGMSCAVRAELVPGEVWVEAPRLVVDGRWATRLAALREPLIALVRAAEPAFELATPGGAS